MTKYIYEAYNKKNKIVQTDTYNRTMTHLKSEEKRNTIETYTLTLRKTPN